MTDGMRVGVVGLGGMGWTHVAGWQRLGAEIYGFDALEASRTNAVEKLGKENVHDTLESLLDAVEVVSVCTPTDAHGPAALAAARAGKSVIVEKPLTRTLAEADELIAVSKENGVHLYVAQVVRFFHEYAAAKRAVEAGRVGRPGVIRLTREGGPPGADRAWFHDPARSGGVIGDLMIHDIDYARWIAGDVVRVFARELRPIGPYQGPTHAYVLLTHESGAISHLTASWARLGSFRTSFEIAGSEGLLTYATDDRTVLKTAPAELVAHAGSTLDEDPWTAELREFAAAIKGGPEPRVTAVDGREALAIALAARESAETGKAVEIAPMKVEAAL